MRFEIVKNKKDVPIEQVMALLKESYWANSRPQEVVETSLAHSDVYYAINSDTGEAIGMGRVLTDYATNYYLSDFIVEETCRGTGIGTTLIHRIVNDGSVAKLRGIILTENKHASLEWEGFIPNTDRCMVREAGTTAKPPMDTDIENFEVVRFSKGIHFEDVMTLMKESYWGNQRSEETVYNSIANSECFCAVAKDTGMLIGMARVITDHAANYYLCDVIVDEEYRRHGVGRNVINAIVTDPELGPLRGILLTRDAHGFYEKFGFVREPRKCMERPRADQKAAEAAQLLHRK